MKPNPVLVAALTAQGIHALNLYDQCGGQGWAGSGTCPTGSSCVAASLYYSQCLPGAASTASTLKTSVTSVATQATTATVTKATTTGSATTAAPAVGNPFTGKQIYANPYYASEISASAIPSLSPALAAKASAVAKVGSYVWLDTAA